jgi:hypothetical protein
MQELQGNKKSNGTNIFILKLRFCLGSASSFNQYRTNFKG